MSSTDNTTEEWRAETSSVRRSQLGMLRWMAITRSAGSSWQVKGHLMLDGITPEVRDALPLTGVGFHARPAGGANAEALVAFPGGAANPLIVASRDEDARKKHQAFQPDSTAMFNRGAIVIIKPNNTVEIRTASGTAQKMIRGETYRTAEDVMLSALSTFVLALGTYAVAIKPIADPSNAATAALATAITTMTGAITSFKGAASTYLTTVLKAQ